MKRKDLILKVEGTAHHGCPGHLMHDGHVSNLVGRGKEIFVCDYCGSSFVSFQPGWWQRFKDWIS